MKPKKIPLRTCVITREKLPKHELIRVVRDKDGNVAIDHSGKANGRGAYLKKSKEVIERARDKKVLNRHLETTVPDEVFTALLEAVDIDAE